MANPSTQPISYTYQPRAIMVPFHNRTERWGVIIAHRRLGKQLALDTEIPMADGTWTTMGDIKVGDAILDDLGRPTIVTQVHQINLSPESYRVSFDDGAHVDACGDHLWDTQTKLDRAHANQQRRRGHPDPQQRQATTKTTREIAATLMYQGENNHTVALTEPVLTPHKDLPIPPYIMGLWLGDGTCATFALTNMDWEPINAWMEYAEEMGFECASVPTKSQALTLSLRQGSATFHPNTLLRSLGFGAPGVKFIPEAYLKGSVEQRMELFAGLMDSDGTVSPKGGLEITFKQREMIDGFKQLACSLGIKLGRPREKWVQLDGWDEPRLYWRLNFTSPFQPFRIERHAVKWVAPHATRNESRKRRIVACEPIDSIPMRCISVDSPSHLYLVTRDYIPTHNSTALLNDLIVRAMHGRRDGLRQQFAIMCPFAVQARSVLWQMAKDYTVAFAKCPGYKISEMSLTVTLPNPKNLNIAGSTIMLLGAENAEKLRGLFLDGIILDEYQDISAHVWDTIIRPALADRQGFAVFSGTVKGVDNPLWELYQKAAIPGSGWFSGLFPASKTGIIPDEELEDLKRNMTEESYQAEFECDANALVTGRILLPYIIPKQVTKVPWQPDGGPVITGWDLGMSDTTSIWTAQTVGKELHLLDFYEESGQALNHFVDWLRRLPYAKNFGAHLMPHDTNVRELGTGVSRLETLRGLGMRNIKVVKKLPKDQQINAGRMLLSRCWFDEDNTREGLKSLRGYQFSYDQKRQCFSLSPLHDRSSNSADAFLTLSVGLKRAESSIETGTFGLSDGDLMDADEGLPEMEAWEPDGEVF